MGRATPCMGCEERYVGRHAKCEKYAEWNAAHIAALEKARAKDAVRQEYRAFMDDSYDKICRRIGRNRFGQK